MYLLYASMANMMTTKNIKNATFLHPHLARRKRSQSVLKALLKKRRKWLAAMDSESGFHRLFEHLPGVFFFAKDRGGRSMFASRGILDLYKMCDESEMLGLTDRELYPDSMAAGYVKDDQCLLSGREKMVERLELWFDRQGMPDWFVVTKLPILDRRGRPHGVMGVLRQATEHEKRLPVFQAVSKAVDLIRRDYAQRISINDIASACFQSLRQLQRQFRSAFGVTPQEFLLKTRVLAAVRLLEETNLAVSEVAVQVGFLDTSAFIHQVRQNAVGRLTPAAYRRRSHQQQ